jgi:hypothetical protein
MGLTVVSLEAFPCNPEIGEKWGKVRPLICSGRLIASSMERVLQLAEAVGMKLAKSVKPVVAEFVNVEAVDARGRISWDPSCQSCGIRPYHVFSAWNATLRTCEASLVPSAVSDVFSIQLDISSSRDSASGRWSSHGSRTAGW